MTKATLVFIFRDNKVLLAMKKARFGKGRWNGIGGKVQAGEAAKEAAIREVKEEIGVDVELEEPLGTITFHYSSKGDWMVYVYASERFVGSERETEEMKPQWFDTSQLPYDQMWDDDKLWYPYLFKRQLFQAEFWFGPHEKVMRHEITTL